MSKVLSLVAAAEPLPDLITALVETGDLFFEWDLGADGIEWTGLTKDVLGVADPGAVGTGDRFLKRLHPEDLPHRIIAQSRHLEHGVPLDCEYRVRGDRGEFHWVQERAVARRGSAGVATMLSGVIRNINDRKHNENQLLYLSTHDELTGHYNRLRLREALEHAIERNLKADSEGSLLLVGIDCLGMIEESCGEEATDTVLLAVARRLERCLRAGDVVGRVGFDRFALVLERCNTAQVQNVAERVLAAIRGAVISTPAGSMYVTASAGATTFPAMANTAREVVSQADNALRNAVRLGSDCFSIFTEVPSQFVTSRKEMAIAEQVQNALRESRFMLAYQPIVDARSGEVVFYEGLARLVDDNGSLMPAATFIPVVERMGLMRLIDRRVLDLGLTALETHPGLRLSINVSGLTGVDPVWLRQLADRLGGRPEVAHRLILEITETVALDDIDESSRFVRTLGELGCRVALDDFGAGFTSFRHLRALDVDMVKIDGSFVRDLARNRDNQVFVRTLVGLAKGIELATVAECVETLEEAELLKADGVQYLQGYCFGRPTVEPEFPKS